MKVYDHRLCPLLILFNFLEFGFQVCASSRCCHNDNITPGAETGGKLVTSSHERSELRHNNLALQQRIREVIPVSDSLRKDTKFIDVCTSRECLKCNGNS